MKRLLTVISSFFLINLSSQKVFSAVNRTETEQNAAELMSSDGELIFAHVIYRHGARNPSELYPNDPFKDEKYWPEGFGQLTDVGKRQQYKLGKYFRRRYDKILGTKYSPDELYVQSTDVDRTLMSALANLAGLFEPMMKDQNWHESIMWQPIPVHTTPKKLDYVLKCGKKCPKYKKAFKKYLRRSDEVRRIFKEYKHDFSYWSKKSGSELETIENVHDLYKILFTEKFQNKTLPDWANEAIEPNGRMEYIATYFQSMATATPLLARLTSGFLLKEMLERFSDKIRATLKPDRSLWFYSAHETTIANMLNSLQLFDLHIPPYASSLHFELFKTDRNDHYIQLFYRKLNEEDPSPMNIPGCGVKCTLEQMYELFDEIIPGDFDSECSKS